MKSLVSVVMLGILLVSSSAQARLFGRFRGQSSGGGQVTHAESLDSYKGPMYPVEEQLLQRINEQRARYGLRALALDPLAHLRARRHAAWMANHQSMVHSTDGAENIAMGYPSVEAAVNGWMNSSGHRANILNPNYRFTGIAGYTAPSGTIFWCEQFM